MSQQVFHESVVVPGDPSSPRNSEADVIELTNGDLLLGWSEFYSSEGHDWSPCRITGKISRDLGRTWSESFRILENEAKQSTMETDFLRLPSGDIALFYCRKNGPDDCRVMMRKSRDDGKTWSEPKRLSDWRGYVGLTDARSFVTSRGRIILPFYYTLLDCFVPPMFMVCQVMFSDDEGETWQLSRPPLSVPHSAIGGCEPAAVELPDGRLLMMLRNNSGRIWQSISQDQGYSWERPEPTDLAASTSPICLERLPNSDDILVIWNQASKTEIDWGFVRNRLSCAISKDGCRTWQHFKNLESLDDQTRVEPAPIGEPPAAGRVIWCAPVQPAGPLNCSYPSCTFVRGHAIITYDYPTGFCGLKLRVLPISWFYDDAAPSFKSGPVSATDWMPQAPQT